MSKKIFIIFVSWLLVFIPMLMIYTLSSQPSTQSKETSKEVVVQVLDTVMPKEEITEPVVEKYQFPVRKAAHFGIFMLLGFCMYNAFLQSFKFHHLINMLLSFLGSVLYAISDETHQNFVDERGPSATDVLIDSSGALIGILLLWLFNLLYPKIMNKKK